MASLLYISRAALISPASLCRDVSASATKLAAVSRQKTRSLFSFSSSFSSSPSCSSLQAHLPHQTIFRFSQSSNPSYRCSAAVWDATPGIEAARQTAAGKSTAAEREASAAAELEYCTATVPRNPHKRNILNTYTFSSIREKLIPACSHSSCSNSTNSSRSHCNNNSSNSSIVFPHKQQQHLPSYNTSSHRRFFSTAGAAASAADTYDVVVVGGGPGGYVAAIKAAQLGLKTACIEKRGSLGGTCLNVGCIPSKAVLNISNKFAESREHFSLYGITGITRESIGIDIEKVQKQKQHIVKTLTQGIEFLFKKNHVHYIIGEGKLTDPHTIDISTGDGGIKQQLHAKNIILATGSEPSPLPGNCVPIDEKVILSSTGALALPTVPRHLAVIGGGVIGMELGSVWKNFGAEVTVIEFLDRLLPPVDGEVAQAFLKEMKKIGIKFQLGTKVVGADVSDNSATLRLEPAKGGDLFQGGRVLVDSSFSTMRYPHIKAIGDLIAGPMLAHKAEEEGLACVEMIAGKGHGEVNYSTIPSVVYTHPEIAGVGKTEEELKKEGVQYAKGKFPFAANSRARCIDISDGFVKVLTEKATDKILGAWIMGPEAGELIAQLVLALEYGASAEDIARTCTAHPTLSEAVKEACMACYDKPIHIA